MIIYYAMTKYHLIFSMTHKIKTYGKQNAILFLYSGLQGIEEEFNRILETGVFNEVYIVPEIELRKSWKPLKPNYSSGDIEENISNMVQDIEVWLPIKITREDIIYLANDHWALGTYCIKNKIPYHYYEDGVGMLSKPDYSFELVKKMNVTHAITAKYMGAFGLNEYVVEKLGDLTNQTEGFYDSKAVHFSLKDELRSLNRTDRDSIMYVFDAPKLSGKDGVTILLTEHFVNMKRLSIEGQREIYAMLVDLFADGDCLCVKPHPNDFQINYKQIFPNAEIISRFFPSELIPYCFDNKIKLALAACSTSVYGLQDISERILRFDIDIENHYVYLLRYWVCAKIVEKLKFSNIICEDTYNDLVDGVGIKIRQDDLNDNKQSIYIVDDRNNSDKKNINLSNKDVLIYLNSKDLYTIFMDDSADIQLEDIYIIRINKILGNDCLIQNKKSEYVWIVTKDKNVKSIIIKMKEKKNMESIGMILDVDCITDSQEMKIKILEGNLKASLERIEKYKEQEKLYIQKIDNLKKQLTENDKEVLSLVELALKEKHEM